MLNKRKQIGLYSKKSPTNMMIFSLPFLPNTSYLQSQFSINKLHPLNLLLSEEKKKSSVQNFRFSFNLKKHKNILLLEKYAKNNKRKRIKFKKYFHFLLFLQKHIKSYPLNVFKKIKGGFMTRSLGITSFMPQSHYLKKNTLNPRQMLLKSKASRRKKRYLKKKKWKFTINMISSTKNVNFN